MRDASIRFRFGMNRIGGNKRLQQNQNKDIRCPNCNLLEDEEHCLLLCMTDYIPRENVPCLT